MNAAIISRKCTQKSPTQITFNSDAKFSKQISLSFMNKVLGNDPTKRDLLILLVYYHSKVCGQYNLIIIITQMNAFIQQGHIILIKLAMKTFTWLKKNIYIHFYINVQFNIKYSFKMHILNKLCSFKLSIHQIILKDCHVPQNYQAAQLFSILIIIRNVYFKIVY